MVSVCPDENILHKFANGELLEEEIDLVQEHLKVCRVCLDRLQSVKTPDTLVEALRGGDTIINVPDTQAVKDLIRRVADLPDSDPFATMAGDGSEKAPNTLIAPANGHVDLGRIGNYRLLRLLGEGGMGRVFHAEDNLNQPVALKVMAPSISSSASARARFWNEAEKTAALRKEEHIVTIYNFGEEAGTLFLVMEFLQGESLEDRLQREGKLPVAEAVRIGRQIAAGLAAAHGLAKPLIHRDIKPSNIWVETHKNDRVKILDFGLAREVENADRLTGDGHFVGTIAYMAPEQADCKELDCRCDLFSLGCVLYRMVTGQMPFKGEKSLALLKAVAMHEPERVARINPEVPTRLDALISRLLAKDRAHRPASALEVIEELKAIEQDLLGTKVAPTPAEQTENELPRPLPVRKARNRSALILAGVLGIPALFVAGIIFFHQPESNPNRPDQPKQPKVLVELDEKLDDKELSFLLDGEPKNADEFRQPMSLTVGEHTLIVQRAGKDERSYAISVTSGKETVIAARLVPPALADDVDRLAAEWVLSIGGQVQGQLNDKQIRFTAVTKVEKGFVLTDVTLKDSGDIDAGLIHLKGCKKLMNLNIQSAKVSDAGLANLKDLRNLTVLILRGTSVTDAGLANFKNCENLISLDLNSCGKVTEAGLVHFKDCKNLSRLDLSGPQVSDTGLANFKDCNKLTLLDLSGCHKVSDAGLANFKNCKILEFLDLSNTRVSDAGLANFKDCKDLTTLNLGFESTPMKVGDAGLANFKNCKNLTTLTLRNLPVSDKGLDHFKDCQKLYKVDLFRTQVGDEGLSYLYWKNLTFLDLAGTNVSDSGLALFRGCEKLTTFQLYDTKVSDAGLKYLAGLPRTVRLNVSRTRISKQGLERLKDALPESSGSEANREVAIKVLELGGLVEIATPGKDDIRLVKAVSELPDDFFQVRRISLVGVKKPLQIPNEDGPYDLDTKLSRLRFPEFDRLQSIDFSGTKLYGFKFLDNIQGLQELTLSSMNLTEEDLERLPKLRYLRRLVLGDNSIRGTGLIHLKKHPELIDLSLDGPQIGNLLSKNLAELKQLKKLSLVGARLSDDGIRNFEGLTNLTFLDLRKTLVSAKGIAWLQQTLPKCRVEWDNDVKEPNKKG
jgi:serine/threonine protein kinase/Leucine-rich repeat (LRR) protein